MVGCDSGNRTPTPGWRSSHHTRRPATSAPGRRIDPGHRPESGGLHARRSIGSAGPATPNSCRMWELNGVSAGCVERSTCPTTHSEIAANSRSRRSERPQNRRLSRSGVPGSAPARIQPFDLRFRRPRREFGGAPLGSGFDCIWGLTLVWVRLDSVPSVALLLPSQNQAGQSRSA